MSTQSIRFNGINRNLNQSDANIGDCEEMINIRSEGGILKIEKDKKQISLRNIFYTRIITHEISGIINYIGFDNEGVIWFSPESGIVIQRLYSSTDNLDDINVAVNHNMLVISDKNKVSTCTYIFNNQYEVFIDNNSLDIPLGITHDVSLVTTNYNYSNCTDSFEVRSDNATNIKNLQGAVNKFFTENKKFVFGYYLIGVNFTLYDNSETKLTNLTPFFPEQMPKNESTEQLEFPLDSTLDNGDYSHYYRLDFTSKIKTHKYTISALNEEILKNNKVIKRINIYISNPISLFNYNDDKMNIPFSDFSTSIYFYPVKLEDSNLDKQLLYKYKSYDLEELKTDITEQVEFGVDTLPTNKTLEVDAGLITRAGQIKVYNNRFHFYNSVASVNLDYGIHLENRPVSTGVEFTAEVYAALRDNGRDIFIKCPNVSLTSKTNLEPYVADLNYMTIVQDSRAYKLVLIHNNTYSEVSLISSSRYNYSYSYHAEAIFTEGDKYSNLQTNNKYGESNVINVTAQNNPIFFPVEHSYIFDGEIKDINYATDPISESQIGQYPLYVFTDRGIYSLEQGAGTVLYGNKLLINTDRVLRPNSTCITRNGVAYIANNSVYILSGRHNLNISLDLKGPIDTDIRQNQSYDLCCANIKLYDISQYLSEDTFDKYLDNAHLCYSPITDDLYVSNPDYPYSYVFSFIYKKWHKISESYTNINSTLIQRIVNITESTMIAATGVIDINSIIIKPEHTFNASYKTTIDLDYTSDPQQKFALIINNEQVATAEFKHATKLHTIIANLCRDIEYLDEYYDGFTHDVFSTTYLSFKVINIYTGKVIIDTNINTSCNSVTIPDKGVNSMIGLESCNYNSDAVLCFEEFTRSITATDTAESIINMLHDLILANRVYGFSASIENGTIQLTANSKGERGNKIVTSCNTDNYIDIHIDQLSGGKGEVPGQYGHILDMSQPIDCERDIHIQSRPISWPNAYTQINRLILNCRAKLGEKHNLSVYIYASNDLIEWNLVQATQKGNIKIDHIRLNRIAKAWKHFIIMIGGKISSNTEISTINLEINTKFNAKLR